MAEYLLSERKAKGPFWLYCGLKPNAYRECDYIHLRKGAGYLTEKLEVCSLLPVTLPLNSSLLFLSPMDRIKLF